MLDDYPFVVAIVVSNMKSIKKVSSKFICDYNSWYTHKL